MVTRFTGIVVSVLFTLFAQAQGGDQQLRAKADGLFEEKNYIDALPLYSQLVSLSPTDRVLNYRFGTCLLFGGEDKDKAIGHLKFAVQDPAIPADAWYWLGRAYHLSYLFKDAQAAYQRYQGTGTKKELEGFTVASLDKQCRNGQQLLSNLKEITVRNKVEVDDTEFFRFYELSDIGGKIVVLPEELKTSLDKKSKERTLVYLPEKGGAIYFGSYGKDGKTGRDIYRTELLTDGKFAQPIKLAGYINTDQDEDFAFLHPDGKNFYFSSKGHNSMGGYDVFRSSFDKGLDTFGPPENLDFAVNTPDDDLFYMVDPENKEACFASGRDSKQGKLHVYRVGTAQVPLVVTVLKGTYASAFDPDDRKALIRVEDAVTREHIIDVRTDMNGSYVLALPRSGQFRFSVDCGPTGKTHLGTVDIPRSTSPRAFRQELELTRQGDLEKLVIHNYFDTPLDEDMIALMMEEIKRRARLDITTTEAPIAQVPPAAEEPKGDVLTQAGFAGDVTEAKAIALAKEDAAELERHAAEVDGQSKEAFVIAAEAATEAERTAREAESIVQAAEKETSEESKNAKMVEAAKLRQRSREANLRARAAYHTGQDLEADQLATRQRAAKASKLAMDLENAITAKKENETLTSLKTLKERLDTKAGPDGELTAAERSRRAVSDHEKEAARALLLANAKRAEENEFIDRIDRAKRERDETRNKSRKEELTREVTQNEQQLAYLHEEVEGAFVKARAQEQQTAVLRGQATLTQHLATTGESHTASALTTDQVAGLGQRIAGNDTRIADIAIDARYDALIATNTTEAEARMFNWELASAAGGANTERAATTAVERDATRDAQLANGRTITGQQNTLQQGEVREATVPVVPVSRDGEELASAGTAVGEPEGATPATPTEQKGATGTDPSAGASMGSGVADGTATPSANGVTVPASGTSGEAASATRQDPVNGQAVDGTAGNTNGSSTSGEAASVTRQDPADGQAVDGSAGTTSGSSTSGEEGTIAQRTTTSGGAAADRTGNTGEASTNTASSTELAAQEQTDPELDAFLVENQRAELQQALAAERNKARRDSLQAQLTALDARIADHAKREESERLAAETVAEETAQDGVDMDRIPATFYPDTKEADIISMVYADYTSDKQRLEGSDDAAARAEGLNGLELMLADSLRGELVRQAAILELDPQQGERVLPKMERLRQMRQDHLQQADRILLEHEAATAQRTETASNEQPQQAERTIARYPVGQDPVADRFVYVVPDKEEIYASKIEHRSSKVADAVAFKDADLARMASLTQQIDSMEESLSGLATREYDKRRKSADRLIDERMIIRADMGQRSTFLMKEEWRTANDSIKIIEKRLVSLGLPPDENLLLMAQGMQNDAKSRYTQAEGYRKRADRIEDIVERDSLYRAAYAMELEAMREMDRAITVKTYLVGEEFKRGETLAYETVARRVLDLQEPAIAQEPARSRATPTNTEEVITKTAVTDTDTTTEEVLSSTRVGATTPATDDAVALQMRTGTTTTEATNDPESAASTAVDGASPDGASTVETERARQLAIELADRTEAGLPTNARKPAARYESFMTGENVILQQEALDPDMDPQLLSIKAERAEQGSATLEQRSLELADRATAMEDSAVTAKKRDKERLTMLAVRTRLESDSLHGASLIMAEEARAFELQKRDAEQAKVLRERLVKYYYLTGEEQSMVVQDPDQSRYFQAKARALEQYDAAADADAAARINRELGAVLQNEAAGSKAEVAAGRMTPEEGQVRHEVLIARAELLNARADSLSNIAARLRGAAGINEGQASVMLQALPADRSTEWMALEMRTRRTEALLAETRDQAGRQAQLPLASGSTVATGQPTGNSTGANDVAERNATGTTSTTGNATGVAPGSTGNDVAAAEPARAIAAPFGTDSRSTAAPVRRPIAEVEPMPTGAGFVIPEALVSDIFELRSTTERSATAIPMDARMPDGVVFKVQIGAFRNAIQEEAFSDMTPVMGEHTGNGLVRYTAGLFMGFQQAAQAKDKVRDRGYRDAFVVAYRNGQRIPLGEAMREARAAESLANNTSGNNTATATTATPTSGTTTVPRTTESNTVLEPARIEAPVTAARPSVIQAPLATPVVAVPETTEEVLARYPATAEAIVAAFTPAPDAASYYNVPGAAPARQVETIRGLFYTVQVGVYSKPVPLGKLFNISPLNSERTETAKVRYTTGVFLDTDQARTRKEETVALGVKDAFITAYLNGKRIPMREASALLEKHGPSILAKP